MFFGDGLTSLEVVHMHSIIRDTSNLDARSAASGKIV